VRGYMWWRCGYPGGVFVIKPMITQLPRAIASFLTGRDELLFPSSVFWPEPHFALAIQPCACYRAGRSGNNGRVSAPHAESPDDRTLLRAVATRDPAAFRQLYERHSARLFSLALKILGDRADAEDVLQETFVQVWKTGGSFDERRGKPLGWLIMLTRSRAIDRLRSRHARTRIAEAMTQNAPDAANPLPTQEAVSSETHRIVLRAVESLPAEQRTALELAYFKGMTQTEISRHLGQPLGTVKTRMRTAMMALREQLGDVLREGLP